MSIPSVELLSVGCHRSPSALSWRDGTSSALPQGLVAYAANNLVAIYDPALHTNVALLRGHSKAVNAVQWIQSVGNDTIDSAPASSATSDEWELVSAGVDKTIIVWKFNIHTREYHISAKLSGHDESVSAISALHVQLPGTAPYRLIASSGTDLSIRVWMKEEGAAVSAAAQQQQEAAAHHPPEAGGWECIQVLSSGRHKIMHCVELTLIPLTEPSSAANTSSPSFPSALLALSTGGVDSRIHLWLSSASSSASVDFASAVSLAGHENWIRSLSWVKMDAEKAKMQNTSGDKESLSAPLVSFMLASASQDKHIRLWKLQVGKREDAGADAGNDAAVQCTSLGSRGHILSYRGLSLLLVLESVLSGHDNWVLCTQWQPSYWVTDAATQKRVKHQPMCLLSASTDKSMNMWKPSEYEGIWNSVVRVGEMGGHTLGFYACAFSPDGNSIVAVGYAGSFHLWRKNKLASGAEIWSPSVTVSGHTDAVQDLCWDSKGDYLLSTSSDQSTRLWSSWKDHPISMPPFGSAFDSSSPTSSTSSPAILSSSKPTWHELSRPQLHGYDLNCLCPLYDPSNKRAHAIASGADEKVVRVFWAPQPFLQSIKDVSGVDTVEADKDSAESRPLLAPVVERAAIDGVGGEDEEGGEEESKVPTLALQQMAAAQQKGNAEQLAFLESTQSRALKANLPELGLSNKALMEGESATTLRGMQHSQQVMSKGSSLSVSVPPTEDYLLSTTLWPEIEKLYGHGYEILSVACSFDGTLLASACVAKKAQHAVIRVWETKEWSEIAQLEAHRSSVIQLAFSPDNAYLLAVSKDRHLSCFTVRSPTPAFTLKPLFSAATKLKAHARIIWGCSWAPIPNGSTNGYYFATGSRDKTVRCFRMAAKALPSAADAALQPPTITEDATFPVFNSAVTAVAFAPLAPRSSSQDSLFPAPASNAFKLTLAVGLEDGRIELWQSNEWKVSEKLNWSLLYAFPSGVCHGGLVKRLAWRWRAANSDTANPSAAPLELASCSEDHSVRIFSVPASMLETEFQ